MMTRKMKIAALLATGIVIVGAAGIAIAQQTQAPPAQPSLLSIALADGTVGEQADGYLGVRAATISPALRAEVDALRIKRRDAYTQLALKKGVTIQDAAAAVGCETLASRVAVGRAYKLPDGIWRVRKAGEVIDLPPYCGS
jgi:uncharacterized protein